MPRLGGRGSENKKIKTKTENQEEKREDEKQERRTYIIGLLTSTRCDAPQEAAWMQLRTKIGYRAIHCKTCGKQQVCARNKCQCGLIWHQCAIHRIDPIMHVSRKGKKRQQKRKGAQGKSLSSNRRAPEVKDDETKQMQARKRINKNPEPQPPETQPHHAHKVC